ncbi:hypothetical protein DASC09_012210 [Saccharomycopsis crataegensis]|uniref:CoA-binding domain-containing protein n=1 Tax=Saccharomycopsis crataegensis TaxID=43959 RepID=A0AAV5QGV1_9ASCO|nr:hypothetical protein DASC09_012210 [Saccharomycopsis crataegensis]
MTALGQFFSSSRQFIVVGASSNPDKFGYKVLNWYLTRSLPVIPINPTSKSILGVNTCASITDALNLENLNENQAIDGFSVSFITAPNVTLNIIQELIEKGYNSDGKLKAFWFQPGSYNSEIIRKSKEDLKVDTIIGNDCILVNGDFGISEAKL